MFAMAQESWFFPEAGEPDQIMQVLIEVNTRSATDRRNI